MMRMTTVITRDMMNDGEKKKPKRFTVLDMCRRASTFIYNRCVGLSRGVKKNG